MKRPGSSMTRVSLFTSSSGSGSNKNNRPNTSDSGAVQRRSLFSVIPHLPPIYQESSDHQSDLDSLHDDLVTKSVDYDLYTSDFDRRQTDSDNVFENTGVLDDRCIDLVKKTNDLQRGSLGMGNAVKGNKDFDSRQNKLKNKTVLGDKQNIVEMLTDHQNLSDASSEESYSLDKDSDDSYIQGSNLDMQEGSDLDMQKGPDFNRARSDMELLEGSDLDTTESDLDTKEGFDLDTTESNLDTEWFDLGTNHSDVSPEFVETDHEQEQIDLNLTSPGSSKYNSLSDNSQKIRIHKKKDTKVDHTRTSDMCTLDNLDKKETKKSSDFGKIPSVNLFEDSDDLKMDTSRITSTPIMVSTPYISLGDIDIEFESETDTAISSRSSSATDSQGSISKNQYKESGRSVQMTTGNWSADKKPERSIGKKDGNQSEDQEPERSIGLMDENQQRIADINNGETAVQIDNSRTIVDKKRNELKDSGFIDEESNTPRLKQKSSRTKELIGEEFSEEKVHLRQGEEKDSEEIKPGMENIVKVEIEGDVSPKGWFDYENSSDKNLYKENEEIAYHHSETKCKRRQRRKHKKHCKIVSMEDDEKMVTVSEIDEGNSLEVKMLEDTNHTGNKNEEVLILPLFKTMIEDSATDHTSDVSSEDELISVFKLPVVHLKNDGKTTENRQSPDKTYQKQKKQQRKISNKTKASFLYDDELGTQNGVLSLNSEEDSDHVVRLPPIKGKDSERNLHNGASMDDAKRKIKMSKLTREKKHRNKERKERAETGKNPQKLEYQNVSLDIMEKIPDSFHDVEGNESNNLSSKHKEDYKIISKSEIDVERDFDQNIGIPVEIEAALTDVKEHFSQGNDQNDSIHDSPYFEQRKLNKLNQLKVRSPRKQVNQSDNMGMKEGLETKKDEAVDVTDRISLPSVIFKNSKSREVDNILDVDEIGRISLPSVKITSSDPVEVESPMSNNQEPRQKVVRKFSFGTLPNIVEKRNSFQSQALKKTKVKQKSSKYAKSKQSLEQNPKQTFLFDLPDEIDDRNFEEQGDVSLTDLKNQNDLDIENTTKQALPVEDNSGNYRVPDSQLKNRPIRKGFTCVTFVKVWYDIDTNNPFEKKD
ncbi:Hypothetical predicted protein [Mytilus galloprovincialis]|uniref:Uncharacterized protein n=1 Tax=Mytilus galloprovincialis TaxID=29158 RepID=A0A8B6BP38_MYTGA|nr:Hypothetical predicted protein [Mytilus galloprovincialis]